MWKAKSPQTYDLARAPKRLAASDLSLSYITTYMYMTVYICILSHSIMAPRSYLNRTRFNFLKSTGIKKAKKGERGIVLRQPHSFI